MNEIRNVVPFADLCALCALDQPEDVIDWLRANDILFFIDSDGRPCSTAGALDEALRIGKRTSSAIIDHDELSAMTGLSQTAAIKRHLRKAGVRVKEVNGRLFTTTAALTESIMGHAKWQKVGPNWAALDKLHF